MHFAAVSPHDGVLDSLVLPVANTAMMSLFLTEVAARHPEELQDRNKTRQEYTRRELARNVS
jgi:hypothetical protein